MVVDATAESVDAADEFEISRQGLARAVADGDLAEARRLIDAAPAAWRRRPALRVLEIRLLFGEGRLDQAEAQARALLAERPGLHAVGPFLVRAVLRQGRAAEARELFEAHVWRGGAPVEIKSALISELIRAGDAQATRLFLDRIDAADALPAQAVGRIAAADWRSGMPERAVERLMAAEAAHGLSRPNQDLLVRVLLFLGRLDDVRPRLEVLAAQEGGVEGDLRRIQLRLLEGHVTAAADLMQAALAKAPDNWFLLKQLGRMPIAPERLEAFYALVAAARGKQPFDRLALWHFGMVALHARETSMALAVLDELSTGDGQQADHAAVTARMLRIWPTECWVERARFRDDLREGVQTVRAEGAKATLVVFPGLDNRLSWLPFDYMDALFAGHPVNVIYLRDHRFYGFMNGMAGLGGDPAAIARQLTGLAERLGAPKIITLGLSVGGFLAIRLGAMMDAHAALSFSGPTLLATANEPEFGQQSKVGMSALEAYPARERDVLPEVLASPQMRIWQFPGADHPGDMAQAQRLAHLPQVVVRPVAGTDLHGTLVHLVADGGFDGAMAEALEGLG